MRTGFSLIEMSVVLLIISIITAGGLNVGQRLITRQAYIETDEQMQEIREALLFFYQNHNRLPCPSSASLQLGASDFGQEIIWDGTGDSCANDNDVPTGTTRTQTASGSGIWVRSGTVPTRTLSLPDSMMSDQFDNRFTYAVMEDLTDNTISGTASANIIVNDGTGVDVANDIAFVLISHGDDGQGAYRYKSGTLATCGSGTRDQENCDGDVTYTDTVFNDNTLSSNYFDDRVIWLSKQYIIDRVMGLGQDGVSIQWAGLSSSTYNGNFGGFIVGDAICQNDIPGSRMLRAPDFRYMSSQTTTDMLNDIVVAPDSGPTTNSGAPWFASQSSTSALNLPLIADQWFNPSIHYNCDGYRSSTSSHFGHVVGSLASGNTLAVSRARCSTSHHIACVYE